MRELTGGAGVEVVYDSVGKDTWERSLDCLRPLGLLVSFGNASGPVPPFAPLVLSQKGSLYVTRPTLFTHLAIPGALDAMAAELFDVVGRGAVQVEIGQRYPARPGRRGAPRARGPAHDRRDDPAAVTGPDRPYPSVPKPMRPSWPSSTSSATRLSPPSGTIRSAQRLLGSTCSRCIGRTVA